MSVDNQQIEIDLLLQAIYIKYGYDFRDYAGASIKRRILKRLSSSGLGSVSEMQHRLLNDSYFFKQLLLDLSINVTEMYRDPSFYQTFREHVIPNLKTLSHVKLWHAGCATGEEVYSLAIMFQEEDLNEKTQVYATDINETVLRKAKEGIFPEDKIINSEQNYKKAKGSKQLSDYYFKKYSHVTMRNSLKKNVLFADHNLATDESFGEMNVILCRNVLIYFNQKLQDRVIGIFNESLVEGGYLCLGTKETISFTSYGNQFKEIDKEVKIYQKI